MKKPLSYLLILLGWIFLFAGGVFVFLYFRDAIILRMNESDQSLIFWYLPILFLGLAGILGGFGLLLFGLKHLKEK